MWSESDPYAYHDLYVITAKLLRKEFPSIKIGGYAACGFIWQNRYDYFVRFLDRVKNEGAPLDFLSWHTYTGYHDTESIAKNARIAREELDKRGFTQALSILDEWNSVGHEDKNFPSFGSVAAASDVESNKIKKAYYENMKNMIGASFAATHFIIMNDLPIDIAAYYDGQPQMYYCGLWDFYALPQKTYYSFKAYGELYKKDRERVLAEGGGNKIWCIANKLMVLISSYGGGGEIEVMLKNPPEGCQKAEIFVLDDNTDLELVRTETLKTPGTLIKLRHGGHRVILIRIVK